MTTRVSDLLRTVAADCSRVADDYEEQGILSIADRMRNHAADLLFSAIELEKEERQE